MTDRPVQYVTSADGTSIALRRFGVGPPVVIAGGALSTMAAAVPLARALADRGLQGVAYDRRARGHSGDTAPYAPDREVDDLRCVMDAAGRDASVVGHSAGAALALLAVARGLRVGQLFLSEPPLRFGVDEPAADLADRLQSLVDAGRGADAVSLFLREDVGLPEPALDQLRAAPGFAAQAALAQSAVYDNRLVAEVSDPTRLLAAVGTPPTILRGDPVPPLIVAAVDRLAAALPAAETVIVPQSRDHRIDPPATAAVIRARVP